MNLKKLLLLPISLVFSAAGCAGLDQMQPIIWERPHFIMIHHIALIW